MKTLADLKRTIQPGLRLRCVTNTLRPELDGTLRTVTTVQGNGFWYLLDGNSRRSWFEYGKAALFQFDGSARFTMQFDARAPGYVTLEVLDGTGQETA